MFPPNVSMIEIDPAIAIRGASRYDFRGPVSGAVIEDAAMLRIVLAAWICLPALSLAIDLQPDAAPDKAFQVRPAPYDPLESALAHANWGDERGLNFAKTIMVRCPEWSTQQCLHFFQILAKKHPKAPTAETVQQMIKTLKRNLAEERERPQKRLDLLLRPSAPNRIADLIFCLRYSRSVTRGFSDFDPERSGPGRGLMRLLRVVSEERETHFLNTINIACWLNGMDAIDALAAIGPGAVPQLLDALADETVLRYPTFDGGETFLRVGDAAACVLNKIAGRRLVAAPFADVGAQAEARQSVMDWWNDYQRKGEKAMLIEGTVRADHDSLLQAAMLVNRHPGAALTPLVRAHKKITDSTARYQLVRLVQFIPGEEADRFLRDQLAGNDPDSRLGAAEALWRRRRAPEALAVVINDWRDVADQRQLKIKHERPALRRRLKLLDFLVQSHELAAVRELAAAFKNQNDPSRFGLVRHVGQECARSDDFSKETRAEVQNLLVAALDENAEEDEWGAANGGFRCADWAALGLGRLWNLNPDFNEGATFRARQRQILAVGNEWCKRQGLPPRPPLEFPKAAPVQRAQIEPLLRRFVDEKTEEGRETIASRIYALGMGALPRINEFLGDLRDDDLAREAVQLLAGRLSFAVRDVRTLDRSMELPVELRLELDKWRGKAPTSDEFYELVAYFQARTPPGILGRIIIDRPEDDSGAVIWVAWRPGQHSSQDRVSERRISARFDMGAANEWQVSTEDIVAGEIETRTVGSTNLISGLDGLCRTPTNHEVLIVVSSLKQLR
jgi:hypothetical protein